MIQQFHFRVYMFQKTQKHLFEKICVPQYSKQHCFQKPSYGSNPNAHQQMNDQERSDIHAQTHTHTHTNPHTHTLEYYLDIQKNKNLLFTSM